MSRLEADTRVKVAEYLADKITFEQLEDFVVGASWPLAPGEEPEATELLHACELFFAEYSQGHRSEAELKQGLREMLTHVTIAYAPRTRDQHVSASVMARIPRLDFSLSA